MIQRQFWMERLEAAWRHRPLVWLSGVRRAGKTLLSQSLPDIEYFDCEIPRVRRELEDPEAFLAQMRGKRIVLDEIHRLPNPSEWLKIAADHFPTTHVLATGSSTLQASAKFRDTLTGRKTEVWLTPMMSRDLEDFGHHTLSHRLLRGGLPPFFLAETLPERDFQEWMDSYWAKDIQELYRLERRAAFQRFLELLFANSGGIFEATRYAEPCEISRTTVANYLSVLEATWVTTVVRPFSTHRPTELITAPKVYAFDTGFVCYFKGWHDLRREDLGYLWEHYVLNEMQSRLQARPLRYWRDKRGHEVDFIWSRRGADPAAIECKWSADAFDPEGVTAFRRQHPEGPNWVVAHDVERPSQRRVGHLTVEFLPLAELARRLATPV
ncbi:MAG: hypothetical protein A3C53_06450 [Omnitrophica WOR_2 bacterium RIFCSPHIGHO2_02_FULL_68_15]|nr:MAG: hypothetical protein A3C53_06450 [Omnitrophica WOR_2 bacterium RIFCSPHIGHO2_02_FULL_68_15]